MTASDSSYLGNHLWYGLHPRRLHKLYRVVGMSLTVETKMSKFRWWICGLLFLATTINYIDRQVIAVLKPTLMHDLAWTEGNFASVVFWFQAAYAAGYLLSGRLMDVIGVRLGYALSVTLWSIAAMAHAAVRSLTGFSVVRFGLGLAEGGNFPAAVKTVGDWFPKKERAFATGLFNSGSNLGPILTPIIVPWLTLQYGWPSAFLVTGVAGFIWLALWLPAFRSPENHTRVSPEELAYIRSDPLDRPERMSWIGLLKYRATWAFMIGMLFSAPIWWFYLFWVPGYLFDNFGLDLKNIGPPLVAVYVIADIGSIGGGWLSSRLIREGRSVTFARKLALTTCALMVVPVLFTPHVHSLWPATLLIGLAAAGHQGWSANLYTMVSDTMPNRAVSSVVGIGGMAGSIAGMFFSKLVGFLLDQTHNNYTLIFIIAPCAYGVALLAIHFLLPRFDSQAVDL